MHMRLGTVGCLVVLGSCLVAAATAAEVAEDDAERGVSYLEAGAMVEYKSVSRHRGFFENNLRIYCYSGENKTLRRIFESIELQLEIEDDDYTQYEGATPGEVRKHYEEHLSLFSFTLFSQKRTRLSLSPFAQQCIGIETIQPYQVRLQQFNLDIWRFFMLVTGLVVFCYAGKLSQNSLFFYFTGVVLGICSSFMLIIWLSSKLVPRRTMMYGVLIGGWTIGIYIIQLLWENLQVIVLTYRTYVFWYILVTGLVSFFFCYRLGPPQNKRSKNIIKWLLQLISLGLIYFSSHFEEASLAIIIITLVTFYFPRSLIYKIRGFCLRRFPPKRRLLTNEEYYEQGVRETTKALEELRVFASSPDCKQWKVMSKLRDPFRFGAFVEGASHLRDEEILSFESANHSDETADSGSSVDDESDMDVRNNSPRQQSTYYRNPLIVSEEMSSEEEHLRDSRVTEVPIKPQRNGILRRRTSAMTYNYSYGDGSTTSPTTRRSAILSPTSTQRFSVPRGSRSSRMVNSARQTPSSAARTSEERDHQRH